VEKKNSYTAMSAAFGEFKRGLNAQNTAFFVDRNNSNRKIPAMPESRNILGAARVFHDTDNGTVINKYVNIVDGIPAVLL
jgi:hypothetical protein